MIEISSVIRHYFLLLKNDVYSSLFYARQKTQYEVIIGRQDIILFKGP